MDTVDQMVEQVRSQLDEDNQTSISDISDILPALNRGQVYAQNIIARHCEDALMDYYLLSPVDGVVEYPIPSNTFDDRIESLEAIVPNGEPQPLNRVGHREIAKFSIVGTTRCPTHWSQIKRRIRLVQTPANAYQLRVWRSVQAPKFTLSQGRIVAVNAASNYVTVDKLGDSVSVESDLLQNYVNLVDGQSGEIKCSMQVNQISGNRITFKTNPTRSEVLGRAISSDMNILVNERGENVTIEEDDYVTLITGTCIPTLQSTVTNFCIQYAVNELTRKLGGQADMEDRIKSDLETQVKRAWVGRESTLKVNMSASYWKRQPRRIPYTTN